MVGTALGLLFHDVEDTTLGVKRTDTRSVLHLVCSLIDEGLLAGKMGKLDVRLINYLLA